MDEIPDSLDIDGLRAETPGCASVLHFDNAGSSLMPARVLAAQREHLELEARVGGYAAVEQARERIEAVYNSIAGLIGAAPDEIALVENATVAWAQAFGAFRFAAGDRIVTAESEYASNYLCFLKAARDRGVEIAVAPSGPDGLVSLAALEALLDERTKLVALTHVPTNGGLVSPAAEIGRLARRAGVPFLLDACQSVGQLAVEVEAIGCDLLSATGRKYLRGPRGSGFLYVRRALLDRLEPAFPDLHGATWSERDGYRLRDDARRFENFDFNYAAVLGLGAAVDLARTLGMAAIEARVRALGRRLRTRLRDELGLPVYDLGPEPCGIVTFTLPGQSADSVQERLRAQAINVSVSSPASTRLDAERRQLPTLVRASLHYFNTEEEIERFCAALRALA